MNGAADMGGMHGFGPVRPEPGEPPFHHDWERRAMGMTIACGALGRWNLDRSRSARESLPPPDYLAKSYYDIWLTALERLLEEEGLVSGRELATGEAEGAADAEALPAGAVPAALRRGGPVDRPATTEPVFAPGDSVRTLNVHPRHHTRLPRYARGRTGAVTRVLGHHVFPDSNARGLGEDPRWLYQVRFDARELFGPDRPEGDAVTLDLWEPYLDRA